MALRTDFVKAMEPVTQPLTDRLYEAHVGINVSPLVAAPNPPITQLLKALQLGKTVRPGSFYSVVSRAQIDVRGTSVEVVCKTYHKINESTAAKAAQVRQSYLRGVEKTDRLSAYRPRDHGLGLVG
jgi:hypothetical protein